MDRETVIRLDDVGVRFRITHERISTLKETVINLLLRRSTEDEDIWALRHVALSLVRGESVGLIGRNGSGKSTLLRVVARVLQPTEGRLTVDGDVSSLIELGAGFDAELTGADNIYLTGSLLGVRRREMDAKFDAITEFSGLGTFVDVPVKNYSSGMYVRLAFSIAIHVEPDILLVNEVLAVGDEAFQRKCIQRIKQYHDRGKTLLIASHALDILATLCSRVVLLEGGRVIGNGVPATVFQQYHDLLADSNGAAVTGTRPAPEGSLPPEGS